MFYLFIEYNKQLEFKIKLLVWFLWKLLKKNAFILTIYLRKRFVNVFYYFKTAK